jgi:ribosomal protein S18 acetylase RimI-like enzyme
MPDYAAPMTAFLLRPMTTDDASRVAALIRTAFAVQSVLTDPLPSALQVSANEVAEHLAKGGGGAVADVNGQLAGSAMWAEKAGELYLSRLAVAPAWRGRGIAKALVAAAEQEARAKSLPRIYLSTRLVLLDNRRLFAACGFVETTRGAHSGYAEPTFVNMEKRLAD